MTADSTAISAGKADPIVLFFQTRAGSELILMWQRTSFITAEDHQILFEIGRWEMIERNDS